MNIFQQSKWIWCDDATTVNQYADFICDFALNIACKNVVLRISADQAYLAKINGVKVNSTQFPDYSHYKVYQQIDVTELVHNGNNRLCVLAYCTNEDSSVYRKGEPSLIFEIVADEEIICKSSQETLVRTSKTYKSGNMEKFSGQLSFSFNYDANQCEDWKETGFTNVSDFKFATIINKSCSLYKKEIKELVVCKDAPKKIISQGVFIDKSDENVPVGTRMRQTFLSFCQTRNICDNGTYSINDGDGIYFIIDLLQESAGYLTLDIEVKSSCKILIAFGEHLQDGRVRSEVGGRQFAMTYFAKPGHQTFCHELKRIGGRYLQVHCYTHQISVNYIGIKPVCYPLQYKKEFCCSDNLHNQIFKVGKRTLELCMHDHYEDTPWREQALYAMDARNQMLCGYYIYEGFEFSQASLRLLANGQRDDGLLELCAPARVDVIIPAFSLCFIIALYENMLYRSSSDFAQEMFPTVEHILSYFIEKIDENGLIRHIREDGIWNFYEWSDGLNGDKAFAQDSVAYESPLHFFLIMALDSAVKICKELRRVDQENYYSRILTEIKKNVVEFWNSEKKLYATFLVNGNQMHYSQLTQSLAICSGVCQNADLDEVLTQLVNTESELVPITLSCSIYKYEALMKKSKVYAKWVMDDIAKKWGKMLFDGATSFWETERGESDFDDAGSLCHGWSAIPVYFYYKYALGIAPNEVNKPVDCGLYEVEMRKTN